MRSKTLSVLAGLAAFSLVLAACGPAATSVPPTSAVQASPVTAASPIPPSPVPSSAPTSSPTTAAPTVLNMAAIFISPVEEPWNTSFLQAVQRVTAAKPHGLSIHLDYTENVLPPDAERVLRQYAQTGKYQIIWAHSSYPDAVKALKSEFPNIVWVLSGSGNDAGGIGGNVYWIDEFTHEPAYLCGIIAGMMTKSNILGAVGAYPYANVNIPMNAFKQGALSVNPNVKLEVTYINNWFDPPSAKEAAAAQIAAGADYIYAERYGPFQAAQEANNVYAFGNMTDQNSLAPNVVVTSSLALWDPDINTVIDGWYAHVTKGVPLNAPTDRVVYTMKDGGSALAPFYGFESKLPQSVLDAVTTAEDQIMSGQLVIPEDENALTSDQ